MLLRPFDVPEKMLQNCWHSLLEAIKTRGNPFQTAVVGTLDESGSGVQLRTIVLRQVSIDNRNLIFFSDIRAGKIHQLRRDSRIAFLFYDPQRRLQIRAMGAAKVDAVNEVTREYWPGIHLEGRKNYAAIQDPGTPSPIATRGLPDFWTEEMLLETSEYAFEQFTVISSQIDEIDALHLGEQQHQRIRYNWDLKKKKWQGGWVVA